MFGSLGAQADAALAEGMMHQLIEQAELTLRQAREEAPVGTDEEAQPASGHQPGELRDSARVVYLVNADEYDTAEEALLAVRHAALAHDLYRVDAEIRFIAPYARKQHDALQYHHAHGKARYLEDPIKQAAARLGAAFRAEMLRVEHGEWTRRIPGEKSR